MTQEQFTTLFWLCNLFVMGITFVYFLVIKPLKQANLK